MAELVMDNPFSQSVSTSSKFAKPVQDLKDCVSKLQEEFADSRIPINDDNQDLHRFCAKFEYLLQAGLKVKTGLLGGKKDYWNYFCDCLGSNKSLNDGIQFVKSLNEVRSNLGRGRALIRFGLTHQRLADTLQQCVINKKVTGDWYHSQSVWLNPAISSDIVNALYDLNDIQFDLTSTGYDLDTSWPSFAKRPYGMAHNLQVPGRSTSISSLSSIPSSLPAQSVDQDTQSQVDLLEHDKLAAEHKSHELENQLATVQAEKTEVETANQMLKSKVTEAELNAKDFQMKIDGNDLLCEKLANELHLKETLWEENEQHLQDCLADSKRTVKRLEESLEKALKDAKEKSNGPSPMDMVELKGKLRVSETSVKTLRIELDSAQKEVMARDKVHKAKDALIDMQDKKLEQQKKQVQLLQKTLQEYQSQKEDRSKVSEAAVKEQREKVTELEKVCDLLRRKNKSLEEMLESVQTKSSDIGKLAKEKLTKYKAENSDLLEKVEKLEETLRCQEAEKTEIQKANEERKEQIDGMAKEKEDFEQKVEELKLKLKQKEALTEEHKKSLESNKEEIKDLRQLVDSLKSESGSKETELTERLIQVQEDHRSIVDKNSDLIKNIEKFEKEATMKLQVSKDELDGLKSELDKKTEELEIMSVDLKEKLTLAEERERQKEGEKQVLLQQLESQREELEVLKQELTSLGKVLSHAASIDEVNAETDLNKMAHSVVDKHNFLHKSVVSMQNKHDELHNTVKATEQKLEETMHDLERFKGEREELHSQLNTYEVTLSDCQLQLQQKTVFVQELQESHGKLEEQIKILETRMEQSDVKLKEMTEDSKMKDQLVAAKQVQFDSLKEKVSLLEELIEQMEEEKGQMEDQEKQLREEIINSERRMKDLEDVVETERNDKESLRKALSEVSTLSEKQQVELERKVESFREKEVELLQTSENKSSVEKQLKEAHSQNALLQQKADSLMQDLETVKSDARNTSAANQHRINELEQGNNELTKQNTSLCDTIQRQERASKEYMEDIQTLKEVKAKLSGKIDKLEEECDKLMQNVQHFQKENDTLSDSVKSLEQNTAKLQQSKELQQSEVETLKKQLEETSQLNEELLSTADQRSKELSEKESKQREMQQQIDAKTDELQVLQKEFSERQSEIESLNAKLTDIAKEKSDLSESMNASFFELKEKVGQYECENEALREEMQSIVADKETQFLDFTQEISKLKQEIENSVKELDEKGQERLKLERKVAELSQELEVFQTTIQEKDAFVGDLQENARKQEEEMGQLQSVLDSEQGSMNKKMQEINSQIAKLQDSIMEKEDEVQKLQTTHQQEVQSVRFQLSTELMQLQNSLQDQKDKEQDVTKLMERISELEFLLEDSQTELQNKKEELDIVKQKQQQQLDDMEEKLFEKDKEGQLMAEQLVRSNKIIEEDLQQVQSERKESHDKLECLQVKNKDMEAENIELKKKIIQLIKEKDSLWKKSDKLEYQKKMKASLVWENSDRTTHCTACNTQFGFTLRKHHCRLCGQVFCYYCCNNWVMTSFSSKKERVCGSCLQQQSQLQSASEGEDSGSEDRNEEEDGVESSVQLPALRSPMWKVRAEDQQGSSSDENNADTKARKSIAEELDSVQHSTSLIDSSSLGDSGSPTMSLDQEKLLSMTDESKSDRLQERLQETIDSSPRKEEEIYDLITSEEVEASLQEPVPDPDTEMAPLLTNESFKATGSVEGPAELWIRPGKAYATAVRIDEAGITLKWEFTTYPKDINFSLMYRETEWTLFEDSDSLIPLCKCNSHKKPVDGELIARKPGIYTLVFDNKSSRFTAKKLMYKLEESVSTL